MRKDYAREISLMHQFVSENQNKNQIKFFIGSKIE
jgi:hypothetical protein